MGNGSRKGGSVQAWATLRDAPGMEDIWQVHYSDAGGKEHNPADDYIANLPGPDQAHWIRLSAKTDGSFSVTNSRNGFTKAYAAK